jgi:hypothetical protein
LEKGDEDTVMRSRFWGKHVNSKLKEYLEKAGNTTGEGFKDFLDKYMNQEYSRPTIELNYLNQ